MHSTRIVRPPAVQLLEGEAETRRFRYPDAHRRVGGVSWPGDIALWMHKEPQTCRARHSSHGRDRRLLAAVTSPFRIQVTRPARVDTTTDRANHPRGSSGKAKACGRVAARCPCPASRMEAGCDARRITAARLRWRRWRLAS